MNPTSGIGDWSSLGESPTDVNMWLRVCAHGFSCTCAVPYCTQLFVFLLTVSIAVKRYPLCGHVWEKIKE